MVNLVCIGRASAIRRHSSRLKSLGYKLHLVGSIDEYLRATDQLGAKIVFVAEGFDPQARASVSHWVRHASPRANLVHLYEHFHDGRPNGVLANVAQFESVIDAVEGPGRRRSQVS